MHSDILPHVPITEKGGKYIISPTYPAPYQIAIFGMIASLAAQLLTLGLMRNPYEAALRPVLISAYGIAFLASLFIFLRNPKITLQRNVGDPQWQIVTHLPGHKRIKTVPPEAITFNVSVKHLDRPPHHSANAIFPNSYTYRFAAYLPDNQTLTIKTLVTRFPDKNPFATEAQRLKNALNVNVEVEKDVAALYLR